MSRVTKSRKQSLASSTTPALPPKSVAQATGDPNRAVVRADSKQARVIAMLRSPTGATIAAMMAATGWQQHSVRGFLAGVVRKRLKLKLNSKKMDGTRIYRIASSVGSKPRPRKSTRPSS